MKSYCRVCKLDTTDEYIGGIWVCKSEFSVFLTQHINTSEMQK